jgi:hypothetical protein
VIELTHEGFDVDLPGRGDDLRRADVWCDDRVPLTIDDGLVTGIEVR